MIETNSATLNSNEEEEDGSSSSSSSHNEHVLTQLALNLVLTECSAFGESGDAHRRHIDYARLHRIEEYGRIGKKSSNAFHDLFNHTNGLAQITPNNVGATITQTHKTIWNGTIVMHFYTEASAQYIATHINGLNTNKESVETREREMATPNDSDRIYQLMCKLCCLCCPPFCFSLLSGYSISIQARLLTGSNLGYDLRRRWESHFFPGLPAPSSLPDPTGFFPSQPAILFDRLPAGHRPDTLILRYIPIAWVDGSLLGAQTRTKRDGRIAGPKLKLLGTMEEDETTPLSDEDRNSGNDDDDDDDGILPPGGVRPPSTRRLLRVVKRQFELLLRPAARLSNLPPESIMIRRWEYQPIDHTAWTKKKRGAGNANNNAETTVQAENTHLDDEMILYPLLNPHAEVNQTVDSPAAHESKSNGTPNSIGHATPLCDVYLMVNDYPTLLACFEYLHNKRMRNRLDPYTPSDPSDSDSSTGGRVIDFGVDVDLTGFLRFERIEERRQQALDAYEKAKAAAQLAAHTARKRAEEAARIERERKMAEEERQAEVTRAAHMARMAEEQRIADAAQAERDAAAAKEAAARRAAALEEARIHQAEERARQHKRREEQRASDEAARVAREAEIRQRSPEEQERDLRQRALDALRRKQSRDAYEEHPRRFDAGDDMDVDSPKPLTGLVPPPPPPPPPSESPSGVVIDLLDDFTPAAVRTLEQWFISHISRPFPSIDELSTLVDQTGLTEAQIQGWFQQTRKKEWGQTNGAARNTIMNTNTTASYADMPPLDTRVDGSSLASRVGVGGSSSVSGGFVMKLKSRPRLQTDEDAAATVGGFVRVENMFDGATSTNSPNQLPASHPTIMEKTMQQTTDTNNTTTTVETTTTTAPSTSTVAPPMALDDASPRSSRRHRSRSRRSRSRSRSRSHRHRSRSRVSRSRSPSTLPLPQTDALGRPISAAEAAIIAAAQATEKRRRSRSRERRRREREMKEMGTMPAPPPPFGFPPFGFPPPPFGFPPPPFGFPPTIAPPTNDDRRRSGSKASRSQPPVVDDPAAAAAAYQFYAHAQMMHIMQMQHASSAAQTSESRHKDGHHKGRKDRKDRDDDDHRHTSERESKRTKRKHREEEKEQSTIDENVRWRMQGE